MRRPCLKCGTPIAGGSYCPPCKPHRPGSTARGYGSDWQDIAATFYGQPCALAYPGICKGEADTADHIVPKAQGGTDDPTNLQPACRPCNSAKRDRLEGDSPPPF